jgi:hypothetical protein
MYWLEQADKDYHYCGLMKDKLTSYYGNGPTLKTDVYVKPDTRISLNNTIKARPAQLFKVDSGLNNPMYSNWSQTNTSDPPFRGSWSEVVDNNNLPAVNSTYLETYADPKACRIPGVVTDSRYTNLTGTDVGHSFSTSTFGNNRDNVFLQCDYSNLASTFIRSNWANLYVPGNTSTNLLDDDLSRVNAMHTECSKLTVGDFTSRDSNMVTDSGGYKPIVEACQNVTLTGDKSNDYKALIISAKNIDNWYTKPGVWQPISVALGGDKFANQSILNESKQLFDTLERDKKNSLDSDAAVFGVNKYFGYDRNNNQKDEGLLTKVKGIVKEYCESNNGDNVRKCGCYNSIKYGIDGCKTGVEGCSDIVAIKQALNEASTKESKVTLSAIFNEKTLRLYGAACQSSNPNGTAVTTNTAIAYGLLQEPPTNLNLQVCAQNAKIGTAKDSNITQQCTNAFNGLDITSGTYNPQSTSASQASTVPASPSPSPSPSPIAPKSPVPKKTIIWMSISCFIIVVMLILSGCTGLYALYSSGNN